MKISKEDIELIEKFIDIRNRGFYADGTQLTELYNRVLEKSVNVTNCGSCLRQRTNELEAALERLKRLSETKKGEEQTPDKVEEKQAVKKENKKVKK